MKLSAAVLSAICLAALLLPAPGQNAAAPAPGGAAAGAPAAPAAQAAAPELPDPVATVEGSPITRAELERAFRVMLSSQGVPPEAVPPEQRTEAYRAILDDMISDRLVTKRSAGEAVTDDELTPIFERFKANFGSEEEMKKRVEQSGQTLDKVREDIRTSLRQQHWVEKEIESKLQVTDAEAEKYFKENQEEFRQVRASHILLRVADDAKPEQVTEREKQAQALTDRARKGEAFDKLASENSEDPGSKAAGGDLDFFSKERMVPEFAEAAFRMKKDEISDPVRTQFGYHIIKVTDRKDPETVGLEGVKPQLVETLRREKREAAVENLLASLRKEADVKIHLPETAAKPN